MLDATEALLKERESSWGDPVTTHIRIAEVWSAVLDTPVTAHQVALCMAGMKLVRASLNPDNPDSLNDAKGYVAIGQRIMGAAGQPAEGELSDLPFGLLGYQE